MIQIVEILLYTLKPGTGGEFHAIMRDVSVPLHRRFGIDVVAYGNSLSDPDAYHLVRAYESRDELLTSQERFYASAEWRNGPRSAIVGSIDASLRSVAELPRDVVRRWRDATL